MPTWPASLPKKVLAGSHEWQPEDNVDAFSPSQGRPITRRTYTGTVTSEAFDLVMTRTQCDTLLAFWRDDCKDGSLAFTASLVDLVARSWWFEPDGPPQFSSIPGGTAYRVSLRLGCAR